MQCFRKPALVLLITTTAHFPVLAVGPEQLILGLGMQHEPSVYAGVEDESGAFPLVSMQYQRFFWRGDQLGVQLFENQNVELDAAINLFDGYGFAFGEMGVGYKGFSDRDGGISYALSAAFEFEPFTLAIQPFTHQRAGAGIVLGIEHEFERGPLELNSGLRVSYMDRDFVNYYVGVSEAESSDPMNTSVGNSYRAGASSNYALEFQLVYQFAARWFALAALEHEWLGSGFKDSPIVDTDSAAALSLGLGYRFR